MNKKENHSAKSEIEQAFLRLMTQKSYMDITGSEGCEGFFLQEFRFYFGSAGQYRRCDCRKTEYRIPAAAGYNR